MAVLLLALAAIALADSISMVPLSILPLTVALGSHRPGLTSGAYIIGIMVT